MSFLTATLSGLETSVWGSEGEDEIQQVREIAVHLGKILVGLLVTIPWKIQWSMTQDAQLKGRRGNKTQSSEQVQPQPGLSVQKSL